MINGITYESVYKYKYIYTNMRDRLLLLFIMY